MLPYGMASASHPCSCIWRHGVTAIGEVSGEPCEHMGEPGLRIDIVELEGLDQG